MDIINGYMKEYGERYDYYKKLAEYCYQLCQRQMDENGIHSVISSRVKPMQSLKNKIIHRNKVVGFRSKEEIYSDIRDIVGLRVALYFPPDIEEVEKIIYSLFDIVDEPAHFTNSFLKYDQRFPGYRAYHYKVKLKNKISFDDEIYTDEVIEIQVASMLMHAWAEVEHDLAYKEPEGGISELEYALLAQLNGLIHTGEAILEQLKGAMEKRIEDNKRKFLNHYELASFIYKNVSDKIKENINTPTLGKVYILFHLLKRLDKNTPAEVLKYLDMIEKEMNNHSISHQITEKIFLEDHKAYDVYMEIISAISDSLDVTYGPDFERNYKVNEKEINDFLLKWVEFESFMTKYITKENFNIHQVCSTLEKMIGKDFKSIGLKIYQIRNYIIHGIKVPHKKDLIRAKKSIDEILTVMKDKHVKIEAVQ